MAYLAADPFAADWLSTSTFRLCVTAGGALLVVGLVEGLLVADGLLVGVLDGAVDGVWLGGLDVLGALVVGAPELPASAWLWSRPVSA